MDDPALWSPGQGQARTSTAPEVCEQNQCDSQQEGGWVHSGPESGLAWPHVILPLYFRGELALYSNNTPSLCLKGTHSVPKTFASTPEGGHCAYWAIKGSNLQFSWTLEWGQNEGCRVKLGVQVSAVNTLPLPRVGLSVWSPVTFLGRAAHKRQRPSYSEPPLLLPGPISPRVKQEVELRASFQFYTFCPNQRRADLEVDSSPDYSNLMFQETT